MTNEIVVKSKQRIYSAEDVYPSLSGLNEYLGARQFVLLYSEKPKPIRRAIIRFIGKKLLRF